MTATGTSSPVVRFLSELRRRRVIRVAVVYAVAGWIVIEVASTMLPGLNLPAWTVTLVIALVVLGFPIAFLMGWMFDIGPGGVQRTEAERAAAVPARQATTAIDTALAADGKERRAATAPNQDVQPMRSSSDMRSTFGNVTRTILPVSIFTR